MTVRTTCVRRWGFNFNDNLIDAQRTLRATRYRQFDFEVLLSAEDKSHRRPNRSEKRALKVAEFARFMKAAGRKAQKRAEPNDRQYDHALQKRLRQIAPGEIDRLMRDDESD